MRQSAAESYGANPGSKLAKPYRALIVPSLGAFEILPTKGKLEGARSRDLTTLSAAPCEHQSIWIVWENARSGSIVTFWRRTAVTRTAAITGGSICRLALIVAFSAAGIRDCFLCIVDREYPLVRRTLQPHRRQSALFRWNFNPERALLRANAAWPRHRAAKTRANDAEDRGQISAMASASPFIPGEME
jgi:hypothetical protein